MTGLTDKKLTRLEAAVKANKKALSFQCDERRRLVKQYVGKHFSNDGSSEKVPLPMLWLVVHIWLSQLAARSPQVLVGTRYKQLMASADDFGRALNLLIEHEMQLGATLSRGVMDALFSPFSIAKVGLGRHSEIEVDGFLHDYGQPYCDIVDLDDFVVDLSARRWDKISFIGDRYTMDYEYVMESGFYENTGGLQPDEDKRYDEDGQERTSHMSGKDDCPEASWEDQIELLDLWLPKQNVLITVPWRQGKWTKPLKMVDWDGPEMGPYHKLSFVDVPGNLLGNAVIGLLSDLHDAANTLYRKIISRAKMSKHILGYMGEASKDAEQVQDALDMQLIKMNVPNGIKEMMFGSPDPQMYAMVQDALGQFKSMAGNLDIMGGLAPMSETLGQDKLLSANSSRLMSSMQESVMNWTKGIVQSIAFYLWEDPVVEMPLTREIPGTKRNITYTWGPQHKEGDFLQYNFDLTPYSMVQHTPAEKLSQVLQLVQQVLVPLSPMMQSQGKTLDLSALLEIVGRYGDLESELQNIIIDLQPTGMPADSPIGSPRSPVTTRTNVRVNKPGSGPGKQKDQITQLMGGRVQPQQAAASQR